MVSRVTLQTQAREEMVDVTELVARTLRDSGIAGGIITLFVPHTTAGLTVNENSDPSVVSDLLEGLRQLVPKRAAFYRHAEGNSDAHIKASLVGHSLQVPAEQGELVLGTWQGIYLCEFDGPRSRKLWVKIAAD